jgi:hypothetical protein
MAHDDKLALMTTPDASIAVTVAAISGLFALLGGFAGAWFSRRSEYEKWLRQERSVAFADFLRQVHSVREKVISAIHDTSLSIPERDMKVTELFIGLDGPEGVVRLYLPEGERKRFSEIKHELWLLHSASGEQTRRIKDVEKILSEIQSMFERAIHG